MLSAHIVWSHFHAVKNQRVSYILHLCVSRKNSYVTLTVKMVCPEAKTCKNVYFHGLQFRNLHTCASFISKSVQCHWHCYFTDLMSLMQYACLFPTCEALTRWPWSHSTRLSAVESGIWQRRLSLSSVSINSRTLLRSSKRWSARRLPMKGEVGDWQSNNPLE